jgi:hypothetical protein
VRQIQSARECTQEDRYLLLVFGKTTVHHEGDERSRTNPGHGYPAYSETIPTTEIFVTHDPLDLGETLKALYVAQPGRTDMLAFCIDGRMIRPSFSLMLDLGPAGEKDNGRAE